VALPDFIPDRWAPKLALGLLMLLLPALGATVSDTYGTVRSNTQRVTTLELRQQAVETQLQRIERQQERDSAKLDRVLERLPPGPSRAPAAKESE